MLNWIKICLGNKVKERGVAAVLSPLGLQEIASFVTKRSAWKLVLSRADKEELLLRVDLDTADFGYAVGEVEVMVHQEAEVPAAVEKINKLSSMLGEGDRGPSALSLFLFCVYPWAS